jgi:hypothetical protein
MKYTLVLYLIAAIALFGCSEKKKYSIPKKPYVNLRVDDFFQNGDSLDQRIRADVELIHSMLQDTLTDQEETECIRVIAQSKAKGTLNPLLIKLYQTQLLTNLWERWDEQGSVYQSPGLWQRLFGVVGNPPENLTIRTQFFEEAFGYNNLSYDAGKCIFSAVAGVEFRDSIDATLGLQSLTMTLINRKGTRVLSKDGKTLAKMVLSRTIGTTSFQISKRPAIMRLEEDQTDQ